MDTTELTAILKERRREITDQMDSLVQGAAVSTEGGISFGKRVGEGTAIAVERMTEVNLHSGLRAELETVDAALAKIDNDTYGVCDACEGPIDSTRLEALPWATHCMDCS